MAAESVVPSDSYSVGYLVGRWAANWAAMKALILVER